jgi:hypothetical protein
MTNNMCVYLAPVDSVATPLQSLLDGGHITETIYKLCIRKMIFQADTSFCFDCPLLSQCQMLQYIDMAIEANPKTLNVKG